MPTTDRGSSRPRGGRRPGAARARARRSASDAERQRRIGLAAVVALLAAIVLAGWWAARTAEDWVSGFGTSRCRATARDYTGSLDAEAMNNAALITAVSVRRGLPPRAATIAIATAMQESKLHNISYGDRDSVGLFQQRPSQGWGTVDQLMDPVYATNAFYNALVKVKDWQTGEITQVAQAVQRSGFPEAYAQHEPEARAIASNLTGETPAGLGCRLDPLGPGDHRSGPAVVASDLTEEMGVATQRQKVSAGTLTVTASSPTRAWAMGAWAVAKAAEHGITTVQVGDRRWTRGTGTDAWTWQRTSEAVPPATVVVR